MEKDPESGRSGRISHFKRVLHQGILNDDIVNHPYKGTGTEDDPFLVTWIDDDPVNPMNYSQTTKWGITILVAIATLAVAFVSSAYSGGIAEIIQEFRVAQIIATLGISLFVLGFAIGPLLWAPLSGKYLSPRSAGKPRTLTLFRIVRSPVPLLWYLHAPHGLQCWCSWFSERPDSDRPEVLGWLIRLFAVDKCWRCNCRYVSCVTQRFGHEYLCCCPILGSCHWPHR
jgi:hypothetical protein